MCWGYRVAGGEFTQDHAAVCVRTIMNRTIFAKLYVNGDTITGHELRDPFNVLAEAYSQWQGYPKDTDTSPGLPKPSPATGPRTSLHANVSPQRSSAAPEPGHSAAESSVSLALALTDQGSSKTPMVEVAGIEPASFVVLMVLLRAQSAVSLLGLTGHAN